MKLSIVLKSAIPIGLLSFAQFSAAKPTAPGIFCATYPNSATCASAIDCSQCHTTPPVFNSYGQSVQSALSEVAPAYTGDNFDTSLPMALQATESLDSDGDLQTNLDEINQGTKAYDDQSFAHVPVQNTTWDARFALQRVSLLYCGHSARYPQLLALREASDAKAYVHSTLEECLNSDYWKKEALHRLGDSRIRPIFEIGVDGAIGIGNYEWDYRLFSYVLSEDRDARDLLLADYHVDANGQEINTIIGRERPVINRNTGALNLGSGQPLVPERRLGMITTQWFLTYFTMFAELPRNTASQAYRAYLGLDIAKGEGLFPVANEPRDVDYKGVSEPECAICHSTLDPLAYAFSVYTGIEEPDGYDLGRGDNPYGIYFPERTPWEADSFLFNEPVNDLKDWAQTAANSDAFKQNLVRMFLNHALGSDADKIHQQTFQDLWPTLSEDNYSANKLIHRIVDTHAFGGKQ